MILSEDAKDAEQQYLRTLGLEIPDGPWLLDQPFQKELTNRSFVVPTPLHWAEPSDTVESLQLASDLPILETAMRKAYIGWEIAEMSGWDWGAFFKRWKDTLLHSAAVIPTQQAFAPWERLLEFQLDNHSGPLIGRTSNHFSRTAVLESQPSGPIDGWRTSDGRQGRRDRTDPSHQPRPGLLATREGVEPVLRISYPATMGECEAVSCRGKWIPVKNCADSAELRNQSLALLRGDGEDRVLFRHLDAQTLYIRIPTLSFLLAEQLVGMQVPKGDPKVLIFDLRGNEGGAADLVFRLLSELIGWKKVRQALSFSIRIKHSCIANSLMWGFAQSKLRGVTPPLPSNLREVLQGLINTLATPTDSECAVFFQALKAKWGYHEHQFPPRPEPGKPLLMVLTDRGCGSDGEFLVYLLASIAGSVVVGTNTAGVGQFARPGYFVLPNTKVPFRLAMAFADFYGDGRAFEGHGLDPDILLDQEQPLDADRLLAIAASVGSLHSR